MLTQTSSCLLLVECITETLYVEVLTPRTSGGSLIWKQGRGC